MLSLRYVDAYHTCYTLAGLSGAQHYVYFMGNRKLGNSSPLESPFQWTHSNQIHSGQGNPEEEIFESEDRVRSIHPIFVIPWATAEQAHSWLQQKEGF